jgi:hypothetical protein
MVGTPPSLESSHSVTMAFSARSILLPIPFNWSEFSINVEESKTKFLKINSKRTRNRPDAANRKPYLDKKVFFIFYSE